MKNWIASFGSILSQQNVLAQLNRFCIENIVPETAVDAISSNYDHIALL